MEFDILSILNIASPFVLQPSQSPLIQSVVELGPDVPEGKIVVAVGLPWIEILRELAQDPAFLHKIKWDQMEQLIAGAYHRQGWNVTLTPHGKNDGGRDVIATRPDFGSIRIVDQVKTYKPDAANVTSIIPRDGGPDRTLQT